MYVVMLPLLVVVAQVVLRIDSRNQLVLKVMAQVKMEAVVVVFLPNRRHC